MIFLKYFQLYWKNLKFIDYLINSKYETEKLLRLYKLGLTNWIIFVNNDTLNEIDSSSKY